MPKSPKACAAAIRARKVTLADFTDFDLILAMDSSNLAALRKLNIRFAYDDFGAGQARLLELAEVPPDILKFDMGLIQGLHSPESSKYLLLGKKLGFTVVIGKALGQLFFTQADMRLAIEIHRRRRQMHQTPHLLFQTGVDHVFGDRDIGLIEMLVTPPDANRAGAVHHHFNIPAQLLHQFRVGQIALDKLRATRTQMLNTLGTPTVDPHTQALLQGKAGETPADKATGPGYQNLHCRPLCRDCRPL